MKCICGYEYLSSWDLEERIAEDSNFVNGEHEFIDLNVVATYETEGNYYNNVNEAKIKACPKCGTLKLSNIG